MFGRSVCRAGRLARSESPAAWGRRPHPRYWHAATRSNSSWRHTSFCVDTTPSHGRTRIRAGPGRPAPPAQLQVEPRNPSCHQPIQAAAPLLFAGFSDRRLLGGAGRPGLP
jgi:hypothetical protein